MRKRSFCFLRFIVSATLILLLCGLASFAQRIPTPEEFLGYKIGADYHLTSYQKAIEYLRALEKSSSMIKLFEMGKTSMGKPMIYAVITSAENMPNLNRFKEISRKLARAKGLTDEEARSLAAEGKAVVYINGGLHSSEVATVEKNIQLAYELLTSKDPGTRLILDNTILLNVFANPDGMDMVAEWYHQNVGTPFEVSPMPWLYNKYVGHDNNRDAFMTNMVEQQNFTRLVNHEWYPAVHYEPHQRGPFPTRIWIPPNAEATHSDMHPLILRWQNLIGCAMGLAFDQEGKPGAISRINYDNWQPGGYAHVGLSHNIPSLLSETNLYRYATPRFYTLDDFPEEYKDFTISAFYPNPWKGGWWRLKDAVDYTLTASKAVLHTAAIYREKLLYDKYQMGRDVIARFQNEPPYAWIIPQDQWDPTTAVILLNKMILQGIEVYKAEENFTSGAISFPMGTWIIPMNQAFAYFVKTMFEEQNYPDLTKYPALWQGIRRPEKLPGVYLPPYDMTGWTLPYQMGVKAIAAASPLEVSLVPVEKVVAPARNTAENAGYAYLISPRTNNSFIAVNRIMKQGGKVLWARESFNIGTKTYSPGTQIVLSNSISKSFMDSLAKELFLAIEGTSKSVAAKTYRLKTPRVALYKSWVASMDEGWTRWLLEQFEFPFTNIHDAEVKGGELRKLFDVLIIPAMGTDTIVNGHNEGIIPPQYVGGITNRGVENIKRFVKEGGTLVTLNSGCLFALDKLGLSVDNALKDAKPPEFACPGSILRMKFDTNHPVAYGMPEEGHAVFTRRSPAFNIISSLGMEKVPVVIAKYPKGNLLQSGYLRGEKYLQHKASVMEVPLGKGKVILLGFGVQNRAQPHGTFKLLFNSLYYSSVE